MDYSDYDVSIKGTPTSVLLKITFRHGAGDAFGKYVAITPSKGGLLFSVADGPRTGYKLSHAKGNTSVTYVQLPRTTKLGQTLVPLAGYYKVLHKFVHSDVWYIKTAEKEGGAC